MIGILYRHLRRSKMIHAFAGISKYGEKAWHLDAMDPNELRDRVREEIEQYIDSADWEKHKQIEEAQRQTTKQIADAMRQAT